MQQQLQVIWKKEFVKLVFGGSVEQNGTAKRGHASSMTDAAAAPVGPSKATGLHLLAYCFLAPSMSPSPLYLTRVLNCGVFFLFLPWLF